MASTSQADRRRKIGESINAERKASGKAIRDDLNRLVDPPKIIKKLAVVEPVGAVPAARARADYVPPRTNGGGGGGINGPLTEVAETREYWDEIATLYSSDYLLAVEIKPLKKLMMKDAGDFEVEFNYAFPEL